jgi:hypothetical protein
MPCLWCSGIQSSDILDCLFSCLSSLDIFDLRNFPSSQQNDVLAVCLEHNPIIAVLTVLRNQCQSMPPLSVSVFVRRHFNSRIERFNSSFGITELCTQKIPSFYLNGRMCDSEARRAKRTSPKWVTLLVIRRDRLRHQRKAFGIATLRERWRESVERSSARR